MGQSTNAILFYGIEFEDGFEFPWGDEEFDKWMAGELGVKEPTEPFSEVTKPLFIEYWDRQREVLKSAPVELVIHCSGDYPMYALAIPGSCATACRGDVVSVFGQQFADESHTAFKEFLAKYNLEHDATKIGWKLASFWG